MTAATKHLIPVLVAVAVHELGHIFAMLALGIKISTWKSRFWGMKISADFSESSYAKELAVILAGSGADLLFAFLLRIFYPHIFLTEGKPCAFFCLWSG